MSFYEAIWHGKGIGDGSNLDEALQSYLLVKPDNGDWVEACSADGANPHIERYASFDDYLDNADLLESIPVTALMIVKSLELSSP